MNPQEILAELDRLGIRVWWSVVGGQGRHWRTPKIRVPNNAPPELCEAIREHNDELLRIMDRRKGGVPGTTLEIPNHLSEPHPPPRPLPKRAAEGASRGFYKPILPSA